MRQDQVPVTFFLVERSGRGRRLSADEYRYLGDMLENRLPVIEGDGETSYWRRLARVLSVIRAGGHLSGREFDRAVAAYIAQSERHGARFEWTKSLVRAARLVMRGGRRHAPASPDPLDDPEVHCFLSKLSMHRIVANRTDPIEASVTAILHDIIPIDQPDYFEAGHVAKFRRDLDWMFRNCRQVVGVSEWTVRRARAYVDATGLDSRASIRVNQLGSFLRQGVAGQADEPLEHLVGKSFAVYCSTIEARKNHIMLLRVWRKLMPVLGDRLPNLVLCGRWGWKVDEVRQFLADHPELDQKVQFVTGISDRQLAWLYRNARFGVFPSHVEGWGLGAAECLDFGLPVLISDADALSEATQGLMPVIPADDFDGWCAAIERASTDDAWLGLLRANIAAAYHPISEAAFAASLLALVQAPSGPA
jgi:glycosyltransferase involved in cell wall biosynthesis